MSPSAKTTQLGNDAETLAANYLTAKGLKVKTRNYRSRWGEIDLIMTDGDELIFVEVRYRRNSDFGFAAETIDFRKQQRITRTALCYTQENKLTNEHAMRFDIISLENRDKQIDLNNAKIEWVKNAFDAQLD